MESPELGVVNSRVPGADLVGVLDAVDELLLGEDDELARRDLEEGLCGERGKRRMPRAHVRTALKLPPFSPIVSAAENVQHEPQPPWFLTGVTAPFSRQSTDVGRSRTGTCLDTSAGLPLRCAAAVAGPREL